MRIEVAVANTSESTMKMTSRRLGCSHAGYEHGSEIGFLRAIELKESFQVSWNTRDMLHLA